MTDQELLDAWRAARARWIELRTEAAKLAWRDPEGERATRARRELLSLERKLEARRIRPTTEGPESRRARKAGSAAPRAKGAVIAKAPVPKPLGWTAFQKAVAEDDRAKGRRR